MLKVVKSSDVAQGGEKPSGGVFIPIDRPKYYTDSSDKTELEIKLEAAQEVIRAEAEKKCEEKINEIRRELMGSAEEEKEKLLTQARYEAAKLEHEAEDTLSKAAAEAVVLREESQRMGYADGYRAGSEDAHKEEKAKFEAYAEGVGRLIEEINVRKEEYYRSHEDAMIECVLSMVKKITLYELDRNEEVFCNLLRQAAKSFKNSDYLKISLADGEVQRKISGDASLIRSIAGNIPNVEIEVLHDAEEGTVILDNDSEIIDASVPTQLEFLREIMNSRKGGGEENI